MVPTLAPGTENVTYTNARGLRIRDKDDAEEGLQRSLGVGEKLIRVTATGAHGATRTYELTLTRLARVCTAAPDIEDDRAELWSGTVTVGEIMSGWAGLFGHGYQRARTGDGGTLTSDTLWIGSESYGISRLVVTTDRELRFRLSGRTLDRANRAKLRLHACGVSFELGAAENYSGNAFTWENADLNWSVGQEVKAAISSSEAPEIPNRAPEFAEQEDLEEDQMESWVDVDIEVDPRNTPAGRALGDPVTADDPDGDPVTYGIENAKSSTRKVHAPFFSIDSETGQLSSAVSFDLLTADYLRFRVKAEDGRGGIAYSDVRVALDQSVPDGAPGPAGGLAVSSGEASIELSLVLGDTGDSPVTHFDVRYVDLGEVNPNETGSTFWLAGPQEVDAGPELDSHIKHGGARRHPGSGSGNHVSGVGPRGQRERRRPVERGVPHAAFHDNLDDADANLVGAADGGVRRHPGRTRRGDPVLAAPGAERADRERRGGRAR